MKVLLVGDGAREHIIAEQLARSAELFCVMEARNPGIESLAHEIYQSDYSAIESIGAYAVKKEIDIALVTAETALAKGLVDFLVEMSLGIK